MAGTAVRRSGAPGGVRAVVLDSDGLAHLVTPVDRAAGLLGALRRHGIGLAVATGRSGVRARDLLGRLTGPDRGRHPRFVSR